MKKHGLCEAVRQAAREVDLFGDDAGPIRLQPDGASSKDLVAGRSQIYGDGDDAVRS